MSEGGWRDGGVEEVEEVEELSQAVLLIAGEGGLTDSVDS